MEIEKAIDSMKRAYNLEKYLYGEKSAKSIETINNLAIMHYSLDEKAQAKEFFEKAMKLKEEFWGEKHPNIIATLEPLAMIYDDFGDYENAKLMYERIYDISKSYYKENDPETLRIKSEIEELEKKRIIKLFDGLPKFLMV